MDLKALDHRLLMRALLLTALCLVFGVAAHAQQVVDLVVVEKEARLLKLMSGDTVIESFAISLGDSPVGHKQREGDEKTPEGRYRIDWRNPNSSYYKSLHISYPNQSDRDAAQARAESPGGDVFIHGLPNGMGEMGSLFAGRDWTDGCIAVNDNEAMELIWQQVKNGTPLEILP